jgi:thioredoxin 1
MESTIRKNHRDRLWFFPKAAFRGVPAAAVFAQIVQLCTLATRRRPLVVMAVAVREGVTAMEDKKKKSLLLKILIPVLIVIAIAGIYVIKNNEQKAGSNGQIAENAEQAQTGQPAQNNEQTQTDAQQTSLNSELEETETPTVDVDETAFELDATDDFDLEEILSHGLPVIIDLGSDSCIPCKEMAPVLEELNEELRGKAIVKFVDVWKNADAAAQIPLRVIPTQFFFDKDGNPYVPSDDNNAFIMYEHKDTGEHLFTAHEGPMEKEDILGVFAEMGVQW